MRYLFLFLLVLSACTIYDEGYDQSLENFDQTGWACDGGSWNIWLYYEAFDVNYVHAIFYSPEDESVWTKSLQTVETSYYQNKFFDMSRQCQPYDVKYILYFADKEPEVVWMYWNEDS